jgi:hypothetical protein
METISRMLNDEGATRKLHFQHRFSSTCVNSAKDQVRFRCIICGALITAYSEKLERADVSIFFVDGRRTSPDAVVGYFPRSVASPHAAADESSVDGAGLCEPQRYSKVMLLLHDERRLGKLIARGVYFGAE